MSIQLVEGVRYVTRDGRVTGPMKISGTEGMNFPSCAEIEGQPYLWTIGGQHYLSGTEHPEDLIRAHTPDPIPATSKTESQIQHAEVCGLLREIRDALREPVVTLEERPKVEAREWFVVLGKHGDHWNDPRLSREAVERDLSRAHFAGNNGPYRIAVLREVAP